MSKFKVNTYSVSYRLKEITEILFTLRSAGCRHWYSLSQHFKLPNLELKKPGSALNLLRRLIVNIKKGFAFFIIHNPHLPIFLCNTLKPVKQISLHLCHWNQVIIPYSAIFRKEKRCQLLAQAELVSCSRSWLPWSWVYLQ